MTIALVAHDARKEELLGWVRYNALALIKHKLYATGTTGRLIQEVFDKSALSAIKSDDAETYKLFQTNKVNRLLSGPLGGDQQIGAMIAEGRVDCLIFFCDNLIQQGHQQDVGALSRLASLYNIPFASNRTTADMLLTSSLWDNKEYTRIIPECIDHYKNRKLQ